ncbi:LysR substrate-binding domain-containing protein [Parasedimentitalea huanghaiensis]|uniref:LysR family transcriptional regulator n=1 Tax=Parasedimentitalea huanghaiensis TaxID=2682100 RepID=A0A6L6WCM8_9RHOB|nr:LysR substrate-binding domain-containing protein [Zongyanglinia huanghaiensis]MVO14295.1 LysR family transcriptional regulator [Zongyanglinia huanghaiensis]
MRRLPPLHALRAFEAAARHLHFKNAAEELGLTPTAISHQVRQLEDILGLELFHRFPRPVHLSPAGEKLFTVVRDSLDNIAGAVEDLSEGDHDSPLKISVTMAFASRWLLARLPLLRKEAGVDVMVEADNRIADLHGSGMDFAIRYAEFPGEDAEWKKLFTDQIIPVCAPALLDDQELPTAEKIVKLPLLHYRWKTKSPNAPSWERWMAQANLDIKVRPVVQSFSEEIHAIEAAVNGQGVILASQFLVADLISEGVLANISEISLPGHSYWAVFLPNHPRRQAIDRLIEWLDRQN